MRSILDVSGTHVRRVRQCELDFHTVHVESGARIRCGDLPKARGVWYLDLTTFETSKAPRRRLRLRQQNGAKVGNGRAERSTAVVDCIWDAEAEGTA